jgi:two-component system chemotaxis sensor kinase CheA
MIDDLLPQFLIEGRELTQLASDDLLALERDPGGKGRIDSAFRAIHTLKGSVALFDFEPMLSTLRAAENCMESMRAGRLAADRASIDPLLDCIAACDRWLDAIDRAGALPPDSAELGARLALALPREAGAAGKPDRAGDGDVGWVRLLLARGPALPRRDGKALTAIRYTPDRDCFFMGDDPIEFAKAIPDLAFLDIAVTDPGPVAAFDPFACHLVIEALSTAPVDAVRLVFQRVGGQVVIAPVADAGPAPAADPGGQADFAAESGAGPRGADLDPRDGATSTLRIDAARIDALVDLVGELVVAKNGLEHLVAEAAARDPVLARALAAKQAEIDRLAERMHRAVMGARMLPLDSIFRRLPRLVRGIAGTLGKDIALSIEGGDVEADKAIVDGLFEPILHLVRNAADHGIEDAPRRRAAGKPPAGRIVLRAGRERDRIVVTVEDDGAGMDPDAIRARARASGLIDEAALAALDDEAVVDLIFTPGFSMAASVTDISGRGVGMDAVRRATGRMGGRVDIRTAPGAGSTIRLVLPQSLTLTTVIVVGVGGERYGIPIDRVIETARIPVDRIRPVHDGEAFVLRDRTIPLSRLASVLGLPPSGRTAADVKVLIVAAGDGLEVAGLEVDGFGERVQIMPRPMSGLLSGAPRLLGTALMGDGGVLMVLDVGALLT